MFYSSKNKSSKDKSFSTKRVKQSGDSLTLSQLGNPNTSGYLQGVKTSVPEKLKYKQQEIEKKASLTKMKTVRSSENMGAEKHAPIKIGEIKLDTGLLEVGYDDKSGEIVFSFAHFNASKKDKMVYENKPTRTQGDNSEWFRSQSQDFVGNSVDFRTNLEQYNRINKDFSKLSNERSHNTTIDKVIPFIQHNDEMNKIEELRNEKSKSNKDRSNIHDAISGVERLKNQKDQRKIDFVQKFTKAVKEASEIKHKFINRDDYILYIKKKWLMMYEQSQAEAQGDNGDKYPDIAQETVEDQQSAQGKKVDDNVEDSKESQAKKEDDSSI